MPGNTLIIGHRGASREAPENTLASFRLAFEQGADGVEADFRLTRDGQIVCLHDDSTGRTSAVDLVVAQATLSQLRTLDVGAWKGEAFAGEPIPALKDVLATLPAGKKLFIEIKSGIEIVPPLAAELAAAGTPASQIMFLSFDAELIRTLKERLPDYRACWLTDYRFRGSWRPSPDEILDTLAKSRADGVASRDRAVLDLPLVRELRKRGLEIHVWTVDAVSAAVRLCELGVDSIMTNRPGWLRGELAGRSAAEAGAGSGGGGS